MVKDTEAVHRTSKLRKRTVKAIYDENLEDEENEILAKTVRMRTDSLATLLENDENVHDRYIRRTSTMK